jgi:hypothetical protein
VSRYLTRKSDSQANAEAVARRDRRYAQEYASSLQRPAPRGLSGLLRWFVTGWETELKGRMHGQGVEWETPGRIERADGSGVTDPGGGNALGAPRWDASTRAHLFGPVNRTDADGRYVEPMHWTVQYLARQHPIKAALLRRIGMGGAPRLVVECPGCRASVTLPDEIDEALVRDALGLAYRHYQDGPIGGRAT